jgi:hypothetical protein
MPAPRPLRCGAFSCTLSGRMRRHRGGQARS